MTNCEDLSVLFENWTLEEPLDAMFDKMQLCELPPTIALKQAWAKPQTGYCSKLSCYQYAQANQLWCQECAFMTIYKKKK